MPAFNRILLCYDGSREGQHALADGARLAHELGAWVHVLSVISDAAWVQGADVMSAVPVDIISDSVKDVLEEGLQKLAMRGINATGHFAIGDPLDKIPLFARDLNIDLIVVGHRRTSGLARWWGGKADGLLLDRVSCSVLVTMGPEVETDPLTEEPSGIAASTAGHS
ncbi:universal stress protein [Paraburkholderia hospita]|uniref:universal stress protein n=1 Tax=Paraburkholderia hospita TaxID=169430 RepID=UPI000B3418C1|nr:universal stress protein [Paraburkholderia hospita]OUL73039.1 universal stress protein UspA [Paraburkholderia hospita]